MKKKTNLLVKNYNAEKESEWIARNLNDTKYISRYISNYIKKNLQFNDFEEKENRIKVKTIEGAATTALRHLWGIPSKNREESDLHHAVDAVVIAAAQNNFINKVREYSKQKELYYEKDKDGDYYDPITKEKVDVKYKTHQMNRPWINFTEELIARASDKPAETIKVEQFRNYDDVELETIKPIFVSRMPRRKVSGPAHKETIYSKYNDEIVTVKKNLSQISKSEIETLINDERCKDLYTSEKYVYDQIYERMQQFDFKAEKAFTKEDVIRKKSKKGEGPIVRSVKVPSVMNAGVEVQKGLAANDSMVRVDVYKKDGKYYLVPIYVADMLKKELPNRAITQSKPESEWPIIDNSYEFEFSLFYNDLIETKNKKGEVTLGYYVSAHRGTAQIKIKAHDGSKEYDLGSKTLDNITKYEVGILGDYHKVTKEKRRGTKKNKEV